MTFFTKEGIHTWGYACWSTISPAIMGFDAEENEKVSCLNTVGILRRSLPTLDNTNKDLNVQWELVIKQMQAINCDRIKGIRTIKRQEGYKMNIIEL